MLEEERYIGQLRIPSKQEMDILQQIVRPSYLQKAQKKAYVWTRNFLPKARLDRFFKFEPMIDMEERFDWEYLYTVIESRGKAKGWIKDGKLTSYNYEEEAKNRGKRSK